MKNKWVDLLYLLILTCFVILFFLPLFYPELKLFATPDGSLSDIFHFNYPLKNLLSLSLKHNALPIWTNLIGMGFPPIAEAEIGAFSAVNIILFRFFATPVAYNLGYITTFLLLAYGTYFVMRSFKLPESISFLCAYVFTFSGFHIAQIAHYNHLQTLSYFPFLFLCWKYALDNPTSKRWLIIPFIASQMIFAGHYQYVFMSGVFLGLYTYFFRKRGNKVIAVFINNKTITILLVTLGLAAIQLLPSYEYFMSSQRNTFIGLFPIPVTGLSLSHLLQFIYPYILGDVRIGTYNVFQYRANFWEAFSYIGVIPFLIALTSLTSIRKDRISRNYWLIIAILLVLAFEGNSPFHFIFAFAPLSWFRIYSRFIALITFILVILFGKSYDRVIQFIRTKISRTYTNVIQILVATIIIIDIWHFATTYNPTIAVATVNNPPESAQFIRTFSSKLTYTLGVGNEWFSYFNANGWKNMQGYVYLLNGLAPNVNMLYGIPQQQVYSGFKLNKASLLDQYIQSNMTQDPETKTASISGIGINLLRLSGTHFVISPYHLSNTELTSVHTVKSPVSGLTDLNMYQVVSAKPGYYIAHNTMKITGIRELEMKLGDPSWSTSYDAIVDTDSAISRVEHASGDHIETTTNSETKKVFTYTSDKNGYFILSTYLYPGWQATLDRNNVPIHSGNIFAMAIFAPNGTHTVEFSFVPASLYIGAGISAITLLSYITVIGFVYRKRV